ncbi:MAG TPA: EAL domain-containing protein [Sulfuriferula sp.]|nr:EAL domain-containing protein [Sulfuriferula sp.]
MQTFRIQSAFIPHARRLAALLGLAAAYIVAARFGLWLAAFMHDSVSAIWPASGLALAVLVLFGRRLWPGVLLGAFIANWMDLDWHTALTIGAGNTLEAVTALWLLNRFDNFHSSLERVRDVIKLVLFAAPIASLASALVGVAALLMNGALSGEGFAQAGWSWWLGDIIGILLFAPPIMVCWHYWQSGKYSAPAVEVWVVLALMLALTGLPLMGLDIFPGFDGGHYLLFVFVIWTALRLGLPATTLVTLCAAALATAATLMSNGTLAHHVIYPVLVNLQTMLAMIALSGLLVAAAIAERKHTEWRLDQLARFDPLTGLANRAAFQEYLDRVTAHAQRHGGNVALLYLDLDHFKNINDTLGHQTGDLLLQIVAARIKAGVRNEDYVARLGGDEFTVLVIGNQAARAAAAVAQKILQTLNEPINLLGRDYIMSASIGISALRGSLTTTGGTVVLDDAQELMRQADTAMYRAKQQHCGFLYFNSSMNIAGKRQLSLESGLRRALEHDEFELYYQPKIHATKGHITGVEALLRWRHPRSGIIGPDRFIADIEATNLIEPVGEWVLREACQQMAAWCNAGLAGQRVAVNLSARQFSQPDLLLVVDQILQETRLKAGNLELEISETTAMSDAGQTLKILTALKQRGVHSCIENFGTGYSSLGYLKRFPIDAIKIDHSFIQELGCDNDAAAIVTAMIQLAHSMSIAVIAEGVETTAQRDFLVQHGCDEIQGFLYSMPLPAEDYADLFGQHA